MAPPGFRTTRFGSLSKKHHLFVAKLQTSCQGNVSNVSNLMVVYLETEKDWILTSGDVNRLNAAYGLAAASQN